MGNILAENILMAFAPGRIDASTLFFKKNRLYVHEIQKETQIAQKDSRENRFCPRGHHSVTIINLTCILEKRGVA